MTQAGKEVIDQQEGTEAGASGDDLDAPVSLPASAKSARTHPRLGPAVVPPDGSRAPSGGGSAGYIPEHCLLLLLPASANEG